MVKNPPAMRETWISSWVGKIPWRRAWQPTPVFLPGESHGQRSLVGYSPWGCKESDTTEQPSTYTHMQEKTQCCKREMGRGPGQPVHKRQRQTVQETIWKNTNENISIVACSPSHWQKIKDCEGLGADILVISF